MLRTIPSQLIKKNNMIENWNEYKDLEYYLDRFCGCDCGGRIPVRPHHSWDGIPKYIHGHNGRGKYDLSKYVTKICPSCGTEFTRYTSCQTIHCCVECYGVDKQGKPLSEQHLRNLQKANCGREPWNKNLTKEDDSRIRAQGCFKPGHTAWNKDLTKETDERVMKYSVSRSLEVRKLIALNSSKRVMEGTLGSNRCYKKGRITLERLGIETYYHSSYELKALIQLDSCPIVAEVSRDSIRVHYKKEDGSDHYYVPDFLVTTITGLNCIVEIKPSCFVNNTENSLKFIAAKRYAARHNMIFLIWTEDILFDKNGVTTELTRVTSSATAANLKRVDDTV